MKTMKLSMFFAMFFKKTFEILKNILKKKKQPKEQLPTSLPIVLQVTNSNDKETEVELFDCINRVLKDYNPKGISIKSYISNVSYDEILRCIAFGEFFEIGQVYFIVHGKDKTILNSKSNSFFINTRDYAGNASKTPCYLVDDPYKEQKNIFIYNNQFIINKWVQFKINIKANDTIDIILYPSVHHVGYKMRKYSAPKFNQK